MDAKEMTKRFTVNQLVERAEKLYFTDDDDAYSDAVKGLAERLDETAMAIADYAGLQVNGNNGQAAKHYVWLNIAEYLIGVRDNLLDDDGEMGVWDNSQPEPMTVGERSLERQRDEWKSRALRMERLLNRERGLAAKMRRLLAENKRAA